MRPRNRGCTLLTAGCEKIHQPPESAAVRRAGCDSSAANATPSPKSLTEVFERSRCVRQLRIGLGAGRCGLHGMPQRRRECADLTPSAPAAGCFAAEAAAGAGAGACAGFRFGIAAPNQPPPVAGPECRQTVPGCCVSAAGLRRRRPNRNGSSGFAFAVALKRACANRRFTCSGGQGMSLRFGCLCGLDGRAHNRFRSVHSPR